MMKRFGAAFLACASACASVASPASAQQLGEVCPDARGGTGALWGLVSDVDSGIGLPGATVIATWEVDGDEVRAEGQAALDGGYLLCHVPLGVELSVRPVVANAGGAVVVATLAEEIARVDLGFALGGGGEADDRVWACFGTPDSRAAGAESRLLRCDSDWGALETCPREEEYGDVEATFTGGGRLRSEIIAVPRSEIAALRARIRRGSGAIAALSRETAEQLVAGAKRLGANALINFKRVGSTIRAEAVLITADPVSCG